MNHSGGSKTTARPQREYRNRFGSMIANPVEIQLRGTLYWIYNLRDDSALLSDFAQDAVQGNRCHMLDQKLSNEQSTNPTAGQSSQGSTDVVVDRATAQLARVQELVEHASAAYSTICPELTIVIPVYNEPETVIEIVQRVHRLPITKQIIVVNDGSTDTTGQSLDQLAYLDDVEIIEHDINRGKGAALQTGFQHARGKFVIVQDADLEYDPIDILKVIAPLRNGQSDVVYGSRYLERADQDPSRLHRFGNWLLTSFSNRMTGLKLTDMETCYKAFRRDVLNQIHVEQSRFGFEPEITAKIARQQVRIQEVGVSYNCRSWKEGKKIGVKDLINTLYCIVRYNWFKR